MKKFFNIIGRNVGVDYPPLIIPEIGINHEGDIDKAIMMVDSAKNAGAEIVKFQCHITHHEMLETDMKPGDISDETLWDIIKRCELTEDEEKKIIDYCRQKNIIFLSTPFSREACDRLESLNVEAYKIGSGECNNLPLINYIASKNKPIILSTGMNNIDSINKSVEVIKSHNTPLILMHCTSMYPTPYNKVRLGAISDLQKTFPDIPVGISDHSLGIATSLGSVALGSCIIEKHFTISRKWPGPDTSISIEPDELKVLIEDSIKIWESRGGNKNILDEEKPVIDFAYASVVSIKTIKKGDKFSLDNIWVKRPGNGELLSDKFDKILGTIAQKDIIINSQITLKDLDQKIEF